MDKKNLPIRVSDDNRSKRYRRRKMQRMLEKDPKLLEQLTKQMLLNGWSPESSDESDKPSDEAPAS